MYWARRVYGIIFIMYTEGRNVGKPNNFHSFENM